MSISLSSDFDDDSVPSRLVSRGDLVRLAPGIYSDEVAVPPERIVSDRWQEILSRVLPGAVVTYRSGFDPRPVDGYLFVSHPRRSDLKLPGLTVVSDGSDAGPWAGDVQGRPNLWLASEARALLDNQVASRARDGRPSRTLNRSELHDKVVRLTQSRTLTQRTNLLASIDDLANIHARTHDAESIRIFFESASGDRPTVATESAAMKAAQTGLGYDDRRAAQFAAFVDHLIDSTPIVRSAAPSQRRAVLPFFEAYFSNYIEGTVFTLDEAIDIVVKGEVPESRPEDAHDVRGTFEVVNDDAEMKRSLDTAEDWLDALKRRHSRILGGRPGLRPGDFKLRRNQAGSHVFVEPELVEGTLRIGWEQLSRLVDPFSRAAFSMYLVAEVHPFEDGNGRTARVMMNAEFERVGQSRAIIPTVFRTEYVSALRAASANARIDSLRSVLDFAQAWTAQVDWSTFETANTMLVATNAYADPLTSDREGRRLVLPNSITSASLNEAFAGGTPAPGREPTTGPDPLPHGAIDLALDWLK